MRANIVMVSKVGIVSHVLPPSHSGQAVMLYHLLSELPSEHYCLISRECYDGDNFKNVASSKLSAEYNLLHPTYELPFKNRFIVSAAVNAIIGIVSRAIQIKDIVKRERCNLLISCTGDLYDLPAAYLASKWCKIPFIPYIFDDYLYQWTGMSRSIARIIEPIVIRNADNIIVPNEYMRNEYKTRYGLDSTIIRNPCIIQDIDELDKANKVFDENEINIVYSGAVYHAHYDAFRNIINALRRIGRSNLRLHLYTAQSESELIQAGITGSNVIHHHHIHQSEVPGILRQAQILFLPLSFNSTIPEVIKTSAPGKIGEYLSVGRPILVHAPKDSFVSWYFSSNKCGVVVDDNSVTSLVEGIDRIISNLYLQRDLGEKAIVQAKKDFDVRNIRLKFNELTKFRS